MLFVRPKTVAGEEYYDYDMNYDLDLGCDVDPNYDLDLNRSHSGSSQLSARLAQSSIAMAGTMVRIALLVGPLLVDHFVTAQKWTSGQALLDRQLALGRLSVHRRLPR